MVSTIFFVGLCHRKKMAWWRLIFGKHGQRQKVSARDDIAARVISNTERLPSWKRQFSLRQSRAARFYSPRSRAFLSRRRYHYRFNTRLRQALHFSLFRHIARAHYRFLLVFWYTISRHFRCHEVDVDESNIGRQASVPDTFSYISRSQILAHHLGAGMSSVGHFSFLSLGRLFFANTIDQPPLSLISGEY